MCGIAGIFHLETPKPVDPLRIQKMCEAQAHRGPDGSGVWTERGVGLGHLRLSIIDLDGSPQPMPSADGRAVISFNGEIYNYRELRRELEGEGARFRTEGDTEVILAAWQRWGPSCLSRLNGMFVFALYDLDARELFIARDRFGVKPLHYASLSDGSIAFSSELKGLLAHPQLRRAVDHGAIESFMTWGYVPDTQCIVAGVRKLPAGHFLHLKHGQSLPQPTQWWDIDFSERREGRAEDLEAELLHILREAVSSRMVSDVPLGAFLSGGVDSSSVVALMSEASSEPVQTCSIGFDIARHDETIHARAVAKRFDTIHRERIVAAGDFDAIDHLVAMFDEPFADASALPTWRVCQLARENVTVALSGDGADEAMAGYRRHRFLAGEDRFRRLLPQTVRKSVFGAAGRIYPKADWAPRSLRAKTTLLSLAEQAEEAYARALCGTAPDIRGSIYGRDLSRQFADQPAEADLIAVMKGAPARSALDKAQYADLKFWLPGDILTKVDRTSMAVSLEAREPLLDHRFVEFAAALPENLRLRKGEGKALLKKAMERYLPDDILYRSKQGFVTPVAEWFRGPLAEQARSLSGSGPLCASGLFDQNGIAQLAERHIAGKADHGRTLWQLVMLDRSIARLGLSV